MTLPGHPDRRGRGLCGLPGSPLAHGWEQALGGLVALAFAAGAVLLAVQLAVPGGPSLAVGRRSPSATCAPSDSSGSVG